GHDAPASVGDEGAPRANRPWWTRDPASEVAAPAEIPVGTDKVREGSHGTAIAHCNPMTYRSIVPTLFSAALLAAWGSDKGAVAGDGQNDEQGGGTGFIFHIQAPIAVRPWQAVTSTKDASGAFGDPAILPTLCVTGTPDSTLDLMKRLGDKGL